MFDYKYSLEIMKQELNNKYISPEVKYAFKASIEAIKIQLSIDVNMDTEEYFQKLNKKNEAMSIEEITELLDK